MVYGMPNQTINWLHICIYSLASMRSQNAEVKMSVGANVVPEVMGGDRTASKLKIFINYPCHFF